jgi:hypothetical protein
MGHPDQVDRDRQLAPTDDPARFNRGTPHRAPGSYWDYNDIRVNALCLALTLAFRRSLPEVLGEHMPPLSRRSEWSWDGYGAGSLVEIENRPIPVVVGGGHWGGGLHDAALGQLIAGADPRRPARAVEAVLDLILTCQLQPVYGCLWWLNTRPRLFPGGFGCQRVSLRCRDETRCG